jgi:hypothetical protein
MKCVAMDSRSVHYEVYKRPTKGKDVHAANHPFLAILLRPIPGVTTCLIPQPANHGTMQAFWVQGA